MNQNFLLTTPLAVRLYHEVAKSLPLIDYHNHLPLFDIANNTQFSDIAELWLLGDPYKHRAMRICGVEEKYITGDASNKEKFCAWCKIFPKLIGNPLYDWSKMEMEEVFKINIPISEQTAQSLWDVANKKVNTAEFSTLTFFERFHVEYVAPCASLTDDLTFFETYHTIAPSLRGDDMLALSTGFLSKLEQITKEKITTLADCKKAIGTRLDVLHKVGCRFSDHALDNGFYYVCDDGNSEKRFKNLLKTGSLPPEDLMALASEMLRFLSGEYVKRGWTMQLHIGAQRFTSTRLRRLAGAAGGFAGIGHTADIASLTAMLDDMEQQNGLPRTLLFTLNPADNAAMAVLSGSYSQDGVTAKVSQGPAWWWCDHLQGMQEFFATFSTFSVLSTFVGMTTDSRSFLSLLRHDYFRRAFCGWLGEKADKGEYPNSFEELEPIVYAVCYGNAKNILEEGH